MIANALGVTRTVADAARKSLDEQVDKLRHDRLLDAGKKNHENLKWTEETLHIAKGIEKVSVL